MPDSSTPPSKDEPLIMVPSHIRQDALDLSTDEQIRIAMNAYDGDPQAIYIILEETFYWVKNNLKYPEAYHDWFKDMLDHFKASGNLKAIGRVPKGRGLHRDRRLPERNECICKLVLIQYQVINEERKKKPTWENAYSDIDDLLLQLGLKTKDVDLSKSVFIESKKQKKQLPSFSSIKGDKQNKLRQLEQLKAREIEKLKHIFQI